MEGLKLIAPLVIIIAIISFIAFASFNSFGSFKNNMDNTTTEYNVTKAATEIINVVPKNMVIITWLGISAIIISALIGIYVWAMRTVT